MKGVLLAGGSGSRLLPLTKVTNKHLLPVGKYPMIYHPLYRFKQAGIVQVLIVTGREHMGGVVSLLGSGGELGMGLTYRVQDEAGGIAQAVGLAENFVGGDRRRAPALWRRGLRRRRQSHRRRGEARRAQEQLCRNGRVLLHSGRLCRHPQPQAQRARRIRDKRCQRPLHPQAPDDLRDFIGRVAGRRHV